jgi:hypothetical protein
LLKSWWTHCLWLNCCLGCRLCWGIDLLICHCIWPCNFHTRDIPCHLIFSDCWSSLALVILIWSEVWGLTLFFLSRWSLSLGIRLGFMVSLLRETSHCFGNFAFGLIFYSLMSAEEGLRCDFLFRILAFRSWCSICVNIAIGLALVIRRCVALRFWLLRLPEGIGLDLPSCLLILPVVLWRRCCSHVTRLWWYLLTWGIMRSIRAQTSTSWGTKLFMLLKLVCQAGVSFICSASWNVIDGKLFTNVHLVVNCVKSSFTWIATCVHACDCVVTTLIPRLPR